MATYVGLTPNSPKKYLGPNNTLTTVVTRTRSPTGADYIQPETGKKYPIGSFWLVGKAPTTGVYGDLWYLATIISNVATWQFLGHALSPNLNAIAVDASTAPGTNPVVGNVSGQITVTGAQVAAGIVGANVIRTNSIAANTFRLEIQRSTATATPTLAANGVAHFNSADFNVDANGFVTAIGSTLTWSDQATNFNAQVGNGYFIIGNAIASLPASPANGDMIAFIVDGAFTVTVTSSAGKTIKVGPVTSAAAGTAANTTTGDALTLVYRSTNTRWETESLIGAWSIT